MPVVAPAAPRTAWPLAWLTPVRCRLILAALVAFGFLSHLHYLRADCPIDLSGDEAQYWDWSRALDWSYYSKGPLVAYVIRASTEAFGQHMWAVRLPALVLAGATTLLTYWLTRRLFGSDRIALGAVLLNHLVPMFIAGSLLMTIDPPYFFCWGLATAFLAIAVLDERRWAWVGAGLALGVGTLAKYGMLLWPVGMALFLLLDRPSRRWLRSPWPWLTVGIGLCFLAPPIVWNVRHDWVTFRHVGKQTGMTGTAGNPLGNLAELLGSQAGVLGPALAPIVVGALAWAGRRHRPRPDPAISLAPGAVAEPPERHRRAAVLLLWAGLPLFTLCVVFSLRSKMQVNWPAAAYFSWMILAAYFLATRMAVPASWKRWRGWVWGAVATAVVFTPLAHDFGLVYPAIGWINSHRKKPVEIRNVDPTAKLKGWAQLGERASRELKPLNGGFLIGEDYMMAAELAFYADGQPKTYCFGSYISDPRKRKRRTQYDVWPDRRLSDPALRGRDAIFVGHLPGEDLQRAFESVEALPDEQVVRRGQVVRRFLLWRCRNFKGVHLPEGVHY